MVEHVNIPDAQRHEPKGISTATAGQVYVADGAGSGSWVKNHGWANYADATHTSGSPESITGTIRTQVTIDAAGSATDTSQTTGLWASNKITPEGLNYAYIARLTFVANSAGSTPYLTVDLDAGGSVGIIYENTLPFAKGASANTRFSFVIPFYVKSTLLSNGGTLYITPSNNITLWEKNIHIQRTYTP